MKTVVFSSGNASVNLCQRVVDHIVQALDLVINDIAFPCFLIHLNVMHHVVFEEIGEMAGALSYIHAIVMVNISGLIKTVKYLQRDLDTVQVAYQKLNNMDANKNN